MSRRRVPSSSIVPTGLLLTVMPVSSSPRTTWLESLGLGCSGVLGVAWGSAMSMPFWVRGVTTMKMMSSTSITSMSGVMLMSDMLSLCLGWVASWEWMTHLRFLTTGARTAPGVRAGGSNMFGGLPYPAPISLAPRPGFGDERDLFDAGFAEEVHDLHDLAVLELLVRLQVDDLLSFRQVLQALLDLGHQVELVRHRGAAEEGGGVLLDRDRDRLLLVLPFLGVPRGRELHVHPLLQHRGDDHEDDEQDDHDVGHRRDVDVRDGRSLAAADVH